MIKLYSEPFKADKTASAWSRQVNVLTVEVVAQPIGAEILLDRDAASDPHEICPVQAISKVVINRLVMQCVQDGCEHDFSVFMLDGPRIGEHRACERCPQQSG